MNSETLYHTVEFMQKDHIMVDYQEKTTYDSLSHRDFCPQTDSRADWPILTRRKDVRSPFCHLYPKNLCSRKIHPTCKDKDKKKSKRTIIISTGWRMNQSKWLLKGTILTVQISWHFKVLNYLKSTCYILKKKCKVQTINNGEQKSMLKSLICHVCFD